MTPLDILAGAAAEIRKQALREARDALLELTPDVSAVAPEHIVGFRSGFAQFRRVAHQTIHDMLTEEES